MAGWFPMFALGTASGSFQLNVPYNDAFLNFMKSFQSQQFTLPSSPTDLDSAGYPKTTLSGLIFGSILLSSAYAPNGVEFKFKNTGTRNLKFGIITPVTITSTSGSVSTSGGSNSNMDVTFTGAGSVTFTFNNYAASTVSFAWLTGFANTTGTGELALIRVSDETAYDAGEYFTPEYLAILRDLNPKTVRTMGWNSSFGAGSNHVKWAHRTTPSTVSWLNQNHPAGIWGGSAATADNIAYTCSNATDSNPGAYVHGELIELQWPAAANASTAPTLNRGGLGAKSVVNRDGGSALSAGDIPANSIQTFYYDSLLGKFLLIGLGQSDRSDGGLTFGIPFEVMVQLANRLNANLWISMPGVWEDAAFSSCATLIRDSLNTQLSCYFELGNEIWNFGPFWQTGLYYNRGLALGFPTDNNRPHYGTYGLRVRQVMALITTAWTATRSVSTLKRVMAMQAVPGFASAAQTYRLNGGDLNGTTYPAYGTYAGANYDTSPNRPIDYCDVISYAPYIMGANIEETASGYDVASAAVLQTAARNFALGGANAATALAWLDGDIRSGTLSGTVGDRTLLGRTQSGGIYPVCEAIAASYDGGRATPLVVDAYEGGLQAGIAPDAAMCATMGITADYQGSGLTNAGASAALAALIEAYRNDATYGYNIAFDQFTAYRGSSFPHSTVPSWLQLIGANQWSLLQGDIFSTKYQTYYGVKAFR